MATCKHTPIDQDRARRRIRRGQVAWFCDGCEATHITTADQINDGYALFSKGKSGKMIVHVAGKITDVQ